MSEARGRRVICLDQLRPTLWVWRAVVPPELSTATQIDRGLLDGIAGVIVLVGP